MKSLQGKCEADADNRTVTLCSTDSLWDREQAPTILSTPNAGLPFVAVDAGVYWSPAPTMCHRRRQTRWDRCEVPTTLTGIPEQLGTERDLVRRHVYVE